MTRESPTIESAIEYLDWYFNSDDGIADKYAGDAWEIVKKEILKEFDKEEEKNERNEKDHIL